MDNKQNLMRQLIEEIKREKEHLTTNLNSSSTNDKFLVNQFALHDFIPNKWFDWVNRTNATIMVIGQDWGPYIALKKYVDDYENEKKHLNFDYKQFLFKSASSKTEKFILNTIKDTYQNKHGNFTQTVYDQFFFTMSVLFNRTGTHFRGSKNFDQKRSFNNSYPFVSRQIEIVKPKVIITLGGMAFQSVNKHFELGMDKRTLTNVITELEASNNMIIEDETRIIPNFHPASYTSPEFMKKIWSRVWE